MLIQQSEATAARRRLPIYLVDATDGFTPETGVTSPTVEVSKNGAAQATGTGSWTEIGDGMYYYECVVGEVDTLGFLNVRILGTGCREFQAVAQVVAFDPYAELALEATSQLIKTETDKIQTIDNNVDAIKLVTDLLPDAGALTTIITHLTDIKGAGWTDENLTTLDTLIDAIKLVTDALPDAGALTTLITHLTDIKGVGWTDENLATMDAILDAINAKTTNLPADPASETNVDAAETAILNDHTLMKQTSTGTYDRDTDSLEALSDKVALDATVAKEAQATTNKNDIITEIDANEAKLDTIIADIAALNNITVAEIWDYLLTSILTPDSIGKLIKDNLDATVSSRASEANATTNKNSLESQATSNTASIIGEIDANELEIIGIDTKVDSIITTLASLNDISVAEIWDHLLTNITQAGSIGLLLKTNIDAVLSSIETNLTTEINANETKLDTVIAAVAALNDITVAEVWDHLLTAILTSDSIGKLIKDNLNVVLSTRSSHSVADVNTNLTANHGAGLWTGGISEGDLHTALDNYANKNDWKADTTALALQATLTALDSKVPSDLENLLKQLRDGNVSYEFVKATSQDAIRNVAVGVLDNIVIKIKNDSDADWSSPVDTKTVYMWYENLGDVNPQFRKEDG